MRNIQLPLVATTWAMNVPLGPKSLDGIGLWGMGDSGGGWYWGCGGGWYWGWYWGCGGRGGCWYWGFGGGWYGGCGGRGGCDGGGGGSMVEEQLMGGVGGKDPSVFCQ